MSKNKKKNDDHHDYSQRYARLPKEDTDQAMVQTPYGPGLVIRTRRNPTSGKVVSRDIELSHWKTAPASTGQNQNKKPQPAMLYSPVDFPSVPVEVGSDVLCGAFGRGRVVEVLDSTQQAKVQLSSWRLAGRSKVTCTMRLTDLHVVRPKLVYEMNVFERVEHAQALKEQARQVFVQKEYERALTKYALAVDAVRYVQHNAASTNHVRADLLLIMITCCNNAATCAAQQPTNTFATNSQNKWDLVLRYAKNALVLIEALEDRQKQQEQQQASSSSNQEPPKTSRVYQILLQEKGMSATKLFGEWKGKALLFIARAHAEKQEYDLSLQVCQAAQTCVAAYLQVEAENKVLMKHDKDIAKLRAHGQQRKKAELKKEKQRAQAMFGGGTPKSPPSSPPIGSSPTVTPAKQKEPAGSTDTTTSRSTSATSRNLMDDGSRKSVTFEDGGKPRDDYVKPLKSDYDDDDDDDDYYHDATPWYQEHQELMILAAGLAVVGLGVAQLVVWSSHRRQR